MLLQRLLMVFFHAVYSQSFAFMGIQFYLNYVWLRNIVGEQLLLNELRFDTRPKFTYLLAMVW